MKQVQTLRELQLIGIFIYKALLSACEKSGVKLYLLGGSLIGAVRHKGFIPWDDDIDVCMSRTDFNKLMESTGGILGDKCRIIDPMTDEEYKGCIPVAVYENSKVISKQFRGDENLKIGVSIFIYDGAPKSKLGRFFYYKKMFLLRAKHALCRADFKNVNTKLAKIIGPILSPIFKEEKVYYYKKKILTYQQKYSYVNSEFVSTNADKDSKKEVFPKEL